MKRILTLISIFLAAGVSLRAQNVIDLRISEALAESDSTGLVDDFGRRGGWIEILNTSQGTVNLAGCYLTDDPGNLTKNLIPTGDLRTQIGPRQLAIFFTSGDGARGTFYTNFKLRPGITVYLVSNDGHTIVDSLTLPEDLPAGKSVSKIAQDNKKLDWQTVPEPTEPSPMVLNGTQNARTNAERMKEDDPHGWILTVTAVSVVFSALAILWFLFWLFFERPAKRAAAPAKPARAARKAAPGEVPGDVVAAIALAMDMESSGDDYAAIALAMHLYFSDTVHDNESFVLTINPSPAGGWNNKALNFRKLPR